MLDSCIVIRDAPVITKSGAMLPTTHGHSISILMTDSVSCSCLSHPFPDVCCFQSELTAHARTQRPKVHTSETDVYDPRLTGRSRRQNSLTTAIVILLKICFISLWLPKVLLAKSSTYSATPRDIVEAARSSGVPSLPLIRLVRALSDPDLMMTLAPIMTVAELVRDEADGPVRQSRRNAKHTLIQ